MWRKVIYMMDSSVDYDIWETNSSITELLDYTNPIYLFIVVEACVETPTLFDQDQPQKFRLEGCW